MPSPAPWTLDWSPIGFGIVYDADSNPAAYAGRPINVDPEQAAANARLMAAAPQLLAALKDIVDQFNVETITAARVAIAKAEGK